MVSTDRGFDLETALASRPGRQAGVPGAKQLGEF